MKRALAAVCVLTLSATAYLSASVLILQPPRANAQRWALIATIIVLQDALTLFVLYAGDGPRLRYAAIVAALVFAGVGTQSIYDTVNGAHFEGYALVLGSAIVVQGLLTVIVFGGPVVPRVAPLRR